jgi:ribonuclease BN (tRNA processing enzyme)
MATLDLLFLGSGNAFGAEGRAFSSFLLNGRHLFDCGPTVLQQLNKAGVSPNDVETVFISHYHADHFFGLPFLMLAARHEGRTKDLTIVGPPGIEQQTRSLLSLGYPTLADNSSYALRYVEVTDGARLPLESANLTAARVEHAEYFDCFAYRIEIEGRSIVYSGDTMLCDGLLRLVEGADVIVTECSCANAAPHLSPAGLDEVVRRAPDANVIVTHLDGLEHPTGFEGLVVAEDLARYRF